MLNASLRCPSSLRAKAPRMTAAFSPGSQEIDEIETKCSDSGLFADATITSTSKRSSMSLISKPMNWQE